MPSNSPPALSPRPKTTPSAIKINPKTKSPVLRRDFGFWFSRVTRINPGIPKAKPSNSAPEIAVRAPPVPTID